MFNMRAGAGVVLAVLSAAACAANSSEPQLSRVGDTVHVDQQGMKLTVDSVSKLPSVSRPTAALLVAGGVFVVVEFTTENVGATARTLRQGGSFKLVDGHGRSFPIEWAATGALGRLPLHQRVNPGLKGKTRLAFDVPLDAEGLEFRGTGTWSVVRFSVDVQDAGSTR